MFHIQASFILGGEIGSLAAAVSRECTSLPQEYTVNLNLSLSTPWRRVVRVEEQIHSFLSMALQELERLS